PRTHVGLNSSRARRSRFRGRVYSAIRQRRQRATLRPCKKRFPTMWSNAASSHHIADTRTMPVTTSLAAAIAIALASAVGTYYFDPRSGRRRRALLRDRTTRTVHQTRDLVDTAVTDARNRARGIYRMT